MLNVFFLDIFSHSFNTPQEMCFVNVFENLTLSQNFLQSDSNIYYFYKTKAVTWIIGSLTGVGTQAERFILLLEKCGFMVEKVDFWSLVCTRELDLKEKCNLKFFFILKKLWIPTIQA